MDRKGLTLIEILMVCAIIGLLSVSVAIAFRSGATAWSKAGSRLEVYQNVRVALDQMSRDLAAAIDTGSANMMEGADSDPDTLKFFMVSGDDLYEIMYAVSGTGIDAIITRSYAKNPDNYDCSDTETTATSEEVGTADMAYGISDLQFLYWDTGTADWASAAEQWGLTKTNLPKAVKITVQTSYRHEITGNTKTRNFETVVYLPNST